MSESFILNGYDFGDTLLEDVYFKVDVDDDLTVTGVTVMPTAIKYFQTLNTKKWLAAAKDSAQDMMNDLKARCTPEQIAEVFAEKCPNGTLDI